MATKRKSSKAEQALERRLSARLELIKQRHHELIVRPRQAIAADMTDEIEDSFEEDMFDSEQFELTELADLVTY